MVMSSFGEGVLPCVPFYRFPLNSSRSAHRLATGRKFSLTRAGMGGFNGVSMRVNVEA